MKKQQDKGRSDDGLTPLQRKERDAAALREKEAKKQQQAGSASAPQGGNK